MMKKTLFVLVLFSAGIVNAQFNSESIYFTGTTNLNTGLLIDAGIPNIVMGLHPEAGYFIKNKLAVGGGINLDAQLPFGTEGSFYNALYDINFGPNIRYYKANVSDWQLYFFGYLHYGIYQKEEEEFYLARHNYLGFQVGPGVNYFFTERVAMEARFSYTYRHAWNSEFGGNHNLHKFLFEIGISVFFPSITFFDHS